MSFSAVAPLAVDALFDLHGESGTYTPARGAPGPVAVLRRREDHVMQMRFGGPGARSPGWSAMLRQSEVPARPQADDRLTIGTETFTIRDVEEDPERTVWTVTM